MQVDSLPLSHTPRAHVFVSGCYDIIHGGHVQFWSEARALGDKLTVCFASDAVLWEHKHRRSSLPEDHKQALISGLRVVDEVVIGRGMEIGLDFKEHFLRIRPQLLVVTDDDKYGEIKRELCASIGARYVILHKTPPAFKPISTTQIVANIRAPDFVPLRVDFAGGWLDVPRHSREGEFVINCSISPLVSLSSWPYEQRAGLGGSAAFSLLNGLDPIKSELDMGVGWQDPVVIKETGLCVWRSGLHPTLALKTDGWMLGGRMALMWTGQQHDTPSLADSRRDYDKIARAGRVAKEGVTTGSYEKLCEAVRLSYELQVEEGMARLPGDDQCIDPRVSFQINGRPLAWKYCGGGWGGYAVYLFSSSSDRDQAWEVNKETMVKIEPWNKWNA